MMAYSLKFAVYICGLFLTALAANAASHYNSVNGDVDYTMYQGVKVYEIDRECAMVGGLCVHTSDCLEPTTNKGLCPSSTHLGAECCYEVPMNPAPCEQHLGVCMDRCAKMLMRPGTDCQKGQVCCVLV